MQPEKIIYFSSTHWDREWYRTVDEFRFRLVPVLDQVIKTLGTDPGFTIFTLDGQVCPLEDYLAVRPEQREALERLIGSGRLIIGPWYTMPDEYLVSSESLVRNLLAGHAAAERYHAKPLQAGYVCDIFGHIANLPQILNGFGITNALISRGTNDCQLECFFRWQSPDGSQATVFKAPETCGYGSFFWEVLSPYAPDYAGHLDEITQGAIAYVERELTRTSLPFVILMDGMDHEPIHPFMPTILERLEQHFGCPVVQQRLDDALNAIPGPMPVMFGELNAHCKENVMHNKVIPHTLSSRYDLKQANDLCQNLLERYAMPAAALTAMAGQDPDFAYLDYAYGLLLQNHAHDSICGCSIAAVHREMGTRFEKTARTAAAFFQRFCAVEYNRAACPDGSVLVKVFNPLPWEYQGHLELDIDFPVDFPVRQLPYIKYEQRNAFRIYDEAGQLLPYNLLSATRGRHMRRPDGASQLADTHTVAFQGVLRPMGFTTFQIRPAGTPYRCLDRFSTGPNSCENQWIRFLIHSDGTVRITDKQTQVCYDHLHSFLDCAEVGDGWFHIRPIQDRVISSLGCPVSIEKTFDGYSACKFLVRYNWALPRQAQRIRGFSRRDSEYTPFTISSEFTVSRSSKVVTVKTVVENTVGDHRLQLHLPTGIPSSEYYVNQCNLILKRQTGLDITHCDWKEADITEYPFESMTFIRDAGRGLLFLSGGGLHEVSCPADGENSMDITLLRCFSKTTGTDGEPDGQLPGKQTFSYALMPLSGETDAQLVRLKDRFAAGFRAFTLPGGQVLPGESGFTLRSENCAYITCMPAKDSGILIRLANYAGQEDPCQITFARPISQAFLCDFLENPLAEVSVSGKLACFPVPPYKMVNLLVRF